MAGPATKAHFPVASESRSEASLMSRNDHCFVLIFNGLQNQDARTECIENAFRGIRTTAPVC